MSGQAWSVDEDNVLRRHYKSYDWELLCALLPGRTRPALVGRAAKLGLRDDKELYWSDEEVELLHAAFGVMTFEAIGAQLGRTPAGVKLKAKRLGLRRRRLAALTPSQIGRMMRVCSKTVQWWIRKRWLKARRAPTSQKKIHLVEPQDLVEFLRAHPERWDARRCPDLHIKLGLVPKRRGAASGERPLWLKEKLAADIAKGSRGKRWTLKDDSQLARLMRRGLTYEAAGKILGRSGAAVDHRVYKLGHALWRIAGSA